MLKPESRGAQQRKSDPLLAVKFKVLPGPLALISWSPKISQVTSDSLTLAAASLESR